LSAGPSNRGDTTGVFGLRRVWAGATLRSGKFGSGEAVEIGEPERTCAVEPLENPVPCESPERAEPAPAEVAIEPTRVLAP
jgi:hypothetical protein